MVVSLDLEVEVEDLVVVEMFVTVMLNVHISSEFLSNPSDTSSKKIENLQFHLTCLAMPIHLASGTPASFILHRPTSRRNDGVLRTTLRPTYLNAAILAHDMTT